MACGQKEQWPSLVLKHKKCQDGKDVRLKKSSKHLRLVAKIHHRKK